MKTNPCHMLSTNVTVYWQKNLSNYNKVANNKVGTDPPAIRVHVSFAQYPSNWKGRDWGNRIWLKLFP